MTDKNALDDFYRQSREHLQTALLSTHNLLDRAVLTLSTAGLGLSIAFIEDIAPPDTAVDRFLLIGSWFLFVVAIVSTIVAFHLSTRATNHELTKVEGYLLNGTIPASGNRWARRTERINATAASAFVFAILATVLYGAINLSGDVTMSESKYRKDGVLDGVFEAFVPRATAAPESESERAFVPPLTPVAEEPAAPEPAAPEPVASEPVASEPAEPAASEPSNDGGNDE